MENIETTAEVQVNDVTVVDIAAKDIGNELNNNETVKSDKTTGESEENSNETPSVVDENADDQQKPTESNECSVNTDNGEKISADQTLAEGESKVDEVSESTDENTEKSQSSSSALDSKDETQSETESLDNAKDGIEQASANANDNEKSDETTVTAPTDSANREQEQTADTNEESQRDSSKKSPTKKSLNKKRKTRSQKKGANYADFVKYTVSVSQRQRRYFLNVTRGRNVPVPDDDCEIFCSNIPINVLEGELIPLFERYGKIWEMRLMMSMRNPKRNAGFAFIRYTSNESASEATEKLNNYEILPGKLLSIRLSQPNLSLFVGNIHRGLTREQIHEKIGSKTKGLVKTFVKSSLYEDTKNCGFCFLEYDCHSAALQAKRLLNRGNVWGRQLFVDWAQRRKQLDENQMGESKTLFINYLPKETTDQQITDTFGSFGTIEKVTKIKDYAFVLFTESQAASDALNGVDKEKLGSDAIEISPAMPKIMKTRNRYPSAYPYRRARQHRRNSSFNQFKEFESSNKFFMRKQPNNTNDNDAAGTDVVVGQTIIPTMVITPPETQATIMPPETQAN